MSEGRALELEQRMELLLEVTAELAGATTEDEIARTLIDKGIAALGASSGALWLLEGATLRMLASSQLPLASAARWAVIPLELDAPLPEAVRTNEAIFLESAAEYQARFPASWERVRDTMSSPALAYALVPLAGRTAPVGGLVVMYAHAQALHPADRTYLRLLARQCGLALFRVQLARAEHAARVQAEEATAAREEILAVVSHDLRNPLGTILMGATSLLAGLDAEDPALQRVRTIAARVQRQSERMARLLEDLVAFAELQAGTLEIERRPHTVESVVAAAAVLLAPIAQERGVTFTTEVAPGLPAIDIDRDRAIQVLTNLVTNALKVTAKGGSVAIGASADGEVVFHVRDTGPGIDAAELPRLFEHYWRSKKATYKGAGLGLSIARGIVDLHGGRIWADSQIGAGTTFYFTLAPRR